MYALYHEQINPTDTAFIVTERRRYTFDRTDFIVLCYIAKDQSDDILFFPPGVQM